MRSKFVFLILAALIPAAAFAETEMPAYEEAMEETPSIEQELEGARAVPHFENGQVIDDYGSMSEAMDQLSLQSGEALTAPNLEEPVPLEDEVSEEPDYSAYE